MSALGKAVKIATSPSRRELSNYCDSIGLAGANGCPKSCLPTVSPDGRWILYAQLDQSGSDVMLVENFC